MCAVTGRSPEDLIGTPFKDYFTDSHRAEDGIRKVLAEDRVTDYELTIRAKDGGENVVSYNATTFKGGRRTSTRGLRGRTRHHRAKTTRGANPPAKSRADGSYGFSQ